MLHSYYLWFLSCAVWPVILGAVIFWIIMVSCCTLLSIVTCQCSMFPWANEQSGRGSGSHPIWKYCALSLSSGHAFAGKIVDFWEESLHRQACVLSACPLFYRSALHQLMTRVDTMSLEKRCDWCYTSLQSKLCQDNGLRQLEKTRGPISDAHLFCAHLTKRRQGA